MQALNCTNQLKLIVLIIVFLLSACGDAKESAEKKPGQALASVNGNEITILQLNDELARAGIRAEQFEAASKQILESLITRQLIVDEAVRTKLDRTPEVMQARERANAQVIAQAYLQKITSKLGKPSQVEIEAFYQRNSEYFEKHKQFDLTIVRIALNDLNKELEAVLDTAKSIDEVTAWLDKRGIQYTRNLVLRSTIDLPSNIVNRILEKGKNHIFVMQERTHNLLIAVNAIKENPLSLDLATPQIIKFLANQKYKYASEEEINRLRSLAKIEYFGKNAPDLSLKDANTNTPSSESFLEKKGLENNSNNLNQSNSMPIEQSIERGMMGLK
ncbi:peptidyl-prolyl cis-trans isomerase, EpsD family [Nitrosomonas sp. PY1]|nr:peptidyl-prolyl cis-trans isomerase, EpsD family [Nitrosomonas sp. PY1]